MTNVINAKADDDLPGLEIVVFEVDSVVNITYLHFRIR